MKKEIKYTDKGYSYIECTREECYKWGGACICDDCNKEIEGTVYLIYVLNLALCERCFEDWQKRSKRYEEDLQLQRQSHIAYYKTYGFEVNENE